jgi:hypothetical protein
MTQAKNTICLWYDGDAEDAARFYAETFPDSSVRRSAQGAGKLSGREKRTNGASPGRSRRSPLQKALRIPTLQLPSAFLMR